MRDARAEQQQRLGDAMDHALDQVTDDVLRLILPPPSVLPVEARGADVAPGLRPTTTEIARLRRRRRPWANASSGQRRHCSRPMSLRLPATS